MHLSHLKTISPGAEHMCKVTALCWSPNNRRLAVVTVDRVVHLFDENGERRDKFSTKPADKTQKTYIVTGMSFSPDSSKLAVAQSDNIVFVYKLGLEWGDKKTICNKFMQTSSVTSLTWPKAHPNEVAFGLQDGKVKIGQLRNNKAATLYTTESFTVTMCSSPDGHALLSGHLDGSIYRFHFGEGGSGPAQGKFTVHSAVPYALSWGAAIVAAGNDRKVSFYDVQGNLQRTFDYDGEEKVKEFTCSVFNPSGEAAVLGNFNSFYTYTLNTKTGDWEESAVKHVENLYTVNALAWKQDGSRLAMGNLTGVVDLYDACIKRNRYKGKFEFTYVSLSQVIVKNLSTHTRIVLKSGFNCEITKINIFQDRFLVANTTDTILVGDLQTCKLSEVPWNGSGSEKFIFDYPAVCMIYNAGELTLVEYGSNEPLGSCRTEYMSLHLISVRINERPPVLPPGGGAMGDVAADNKKIAYLLDIQTIRVQDLVTGAMSTISHDSRIDWLELNGRGNLILFRDKRRRLHVYDTLREERSTLLNFCSYVQWVPNSDVVVAQSRNTLNIWYNIYAPDKVTTIEIRGDVEEIERVDGQTEVVVDEGINTVTYRLDEGLIGFGTAMEDGKLEAAMGILDGLNDSPETRAMWAKLEEAALERGKLLIAERCAAAKGDIPRARFLKKTRKIAKDAAVQLGVDGNEFWLVRARLAQLTGDLSGAEAIYVENGKIEEAIEMYQTLHRWDEAIEVAESRGLPEAGEMRRQYFKYLQDSGQEDKAAALKEREGDHLSAINLYLQGGYPGKAASIIMARPGGFNQDLLQRVVRALSAGGLHEKAGELLEKMDQKQAALDAYVNGHAYRQAVDLARRAFPGQVVQLEKAWADYLVSQQQVDAAINHYIEAGAYTAAINAALNAKQYQRAVQLVDDSLRDPEVANPFYKRIARHYREAGQLSLADQFYVRAGEGKTSVDMFIEAGDWETAHKRALSCMSKQEVNNLYIGRAQQMEADGKHGQAEKLYLTVGEPDLAINMYKKSRQYDQMIRLVKKYRQDLLKDTHLHLAHQLEMEGNLKDAEQHYTDAGEWESAVNMYRSNDMWEEAFRVAKVRGGGLAANRVAYAWAVSIGGEDGSKLLNRLGLIEQAIDYAIETGAFDHAFQLARENLKRKVPDVHFKYAMYLEDEGRFKEAEEEFIKADKPKEGIEMYTHNQDWASAMRVAEAYEPSAIPDIMVAQGRVAEESQDLVRAETLYVDAKRPELAVRAYVNATKFPEAVRVAKKHMPHKISEVFHEIRNILQTKGCSKDEYISIAKMWENAREFGLAIDSYLGVTQELVSDPEELAHIWSRAVQLADSHERHRYMEVAGKVANRMFDIGNFAKAGDLFKDVEMYKEAIDCFIKEKNWAKAQDITRNYAPQFKKYVDEKYETVLTQAGDADNLVSLGKLDTALEMYVTRGEWDKVFEVASKQGGSKAVTKYSTPFMEEVLKKGQPWEIVDIFNKYGVPASVSLLGNFQRMIAQLLSGSMAKVPKDEDLIPCKDMLFKVVSAVKRVSGDAPQVRDYDRLLLILHYYATRALARQHGLEEIVAKLSVCLLRFLDPVPVDRAFYEAGHHARTMKWTSLAFVLLNRYLDVSEAIEDGDAGMIDNSDFTYTDIPSPYDFSLPKEQCLDEGKREEVRDWVLAISMDSSVAQTLPTRKCHNCNSEMYQYASSCWNCQKQYPTCIVSGVPVLPGQAVNCKNCQSVADKTMWNKFVVAAKACPWCSVAQTPVYQAP